LRDGRIAALRSQMLVLPKVRLERATLYTDHAPQLDVRHATHHLVSR
jgi:hypothetical protein